MEKLEDEAADYKRQSLSTPKVKKNMSGCFTC